MSRRRARLQRAALPLSYSSRLDPTPGIEPGPGSSADRRLPTWPGRVALAPGEGLEPPSRGSEPRVLPVRPPWCFEVWRPRRGSNPPPPARQAVVPSRGLRGRDNESVVVVRRGGFAPPQPGATGLRPAGLACARAGALFTTRVWLAMPIRFSMCGSRILRAKRKGPGVARPLVGSLFSSGSCSYSHSGDSGPGDARMGSYPRTDVLAGHIGAGRRPQPTFRLRVPNPSSFCL